MNLIIHMKRLLDSDWLRAVQFKCNTGAKSVTVHWWTRANYTSWFWIMIGKDNEKFCKPIIPCKTMTKIGSCVFCAPLDRYIGRHLGRHIDRDSTYVSVDILAECQLICRSTYDRHIGRLSVDMSTRCVGRPINWCINQDIGRVMVDISTDYQQISQSILWPTLGRYADHWLSAEYRSTVGGISVKSLDCQCISYTHFILFRSTSKISQGFKLGLHVPQIQSLSSKTGLKWNTAKYTKYSW